MIDIKFNVPPYVDKAADYIQECVKNQKICGDGEYTKKCNACLLIRLCPLRMRSCSAARFRYLWISVRIP